MTELERYKKALRVAQLAYRGAARWHVENTDKEIEHILTAPPPPEYEEVEVVRWAIFDKFDNLVCTIDQSDYGNATMEDSDRAVKLTGVDRREKPRPVERSVGMVLSGQGWSVDGVFEDYHPGIKGVFTYTK